MRDALRLFYRRRNPPLTHRERKNPAELAERAPGLGGPIVEGGLRRGAGVPGGRLLPDHAGLDQRPHHVAGEQEVCPVSAYWTD